jgi:glycine/D-amino acid oxidase-like deaminating enzyme
MARMSGAGYDVSRRTFLMTSLAAPLAVRPQAPRPHVIVVGAGAFGGWTALHLLRRGARVTLVDTWGPGNSRASSGGETRIIRATYGPNRPYVELVARSLQLWKEEERRWSRRLYYPTGVLWMAGKDKQYAEASAPIVREAGLRIDALTRAEAAARYPQIDFDGVELVLHEPDAGYLTARLSCEAVLDGFLAEGGDFRQAQVRPQEPAGELRGLTLADGATLTADRYVFACGPWMNSVLGASLGYRIRPSRQEVFYFGTPAADRRFDEERAPAWIDNSQERTWYGIPGNRWRGFKVADDSRGPEFEPTNGDRRPSEAGVRAVRGQLERRFPALKGAPLLGAEVCQYENSPDGNWIIDRHPAAPNAWVVGGGSGHGFKAGPAVGELTARLVLEDRLADPFFRAARFAGQKTRDMQWK